MPCDVCVLGMQGIFSLATVTTHPLPFPDPSVDTFTPGMGTGEGQGRKRDGATAIQPLAQQVRHHPTITPTVHTTQRGRQYTRTRGSHHATITSCLFCRLVSRLFSLFLSPSCAVTLSSRLLCYIYLLYIRLFCCDSPLNPPYVLTLPLCCDLWLQLLKAMEQYLQHRPQNQPLLRGGSHPL